MTFEPTSHAARARSGADEPGNDGIETLRARLAEAEDMLAAIRTGEVDALVVAVPGGDRVYTLEGAETSYRVFVEQMQEGAIVVNSEGMIVYSNLRFAELVGLPLERVIGSPMRPLAVPDDADALATILGLGSTSTTKGEIGLRGPGGRRVPVFVAASPLPADEAERTCVIVTDLTPQKRSQELEEARDALARKAAELTRSNADLGSFAHVAAHDLKEPLRGIRHLVGFLTEDYGETLGPEGRAKLESLDRLSGRMNGLLDSLLEYSRVGQGDLRLRPTDLGVVLGEVLAALAPWLRERHAQVTVGRLPTVRCDPALAGRLFQHLITNAVTYNDASPRRVEIDTLARPGACPAFFVRDNGIGIPQEHHTIIFRMFKRLVRDERYGGGTGAGLTIAKRIVERHGGRIWLESAAGGGSTFYFTLEHDPADAQAPA